MVPLFRSLRSGGAPWCALLLALAALPAWAAAPAGPPRTLRVLIEHQSAPFSRLTPDGRAEGFAPELMRAIAADQGLAVEFDLRPWQHIYTDFLAGRGEILGLVAFSEERAQHMDFSISYETMYCGLYLRDDAPDIRTVEDLHGKRVAVIRNAITHEYIRQKKLPVTVIELDSLAQCLAAVQQGTADVAFGMEFVTNYILRTQDIRGIREADLLLRDLSYTLGFAVQPGDKRLLARINEGMTRLRANGTYDQIYEKWLGPLQPRQLRWRELQVYALPLAALFGAGLLALAWQRRMLRRLAEHAEALRQSEERLSLVLEGSQDGFWDWHVPADRITRSARWSEMLGYAPGEIAGNAAAFAALVHPDDQPHLREVEQESWSGRDHFAVEFRMKTRSGDWKWILDRGKVVARDPATGAPLRLAGTHTDISARKQAEEENEKLQRKMLETQKLESLGVLAGGIAHDFNNLLTVILGNTALVRLDQGAGSAHAAHLDKVLSASNRAADLCRQLLAYAGKGAFTSERLDLNELARDTTHLLELSLSRAQLEFALAPALPAIEGDPTQIRQVIMNLVLNASEALGDNPGRIRVATRPVALRDGELASALPSAELPAGTYVCLEVSDTGSGMTPDVLARIFDPFFTTKFTGRGLGLAAVLGIVRSHRGALTVHSTLGRGSLFRIYLPAAAAPAAAPAPAAPPAAPHRAGTVLVADDEPTVRQLLAEMLGRLGYEPVVASDGAEALALFRTTPARFHVALLDISMPQMDGPATLQHLRVARPDLPCILLSGHGEHDALSRIPAGVAASFLQKPFTPESLLASLRQVVQAAS